MTTATSPGSAGPRIPSWAQPRLAGRREAVARGLRTAFFAVGGLDLVSLLAGWHPGHLAAKPLLMPLLMAYVLTRRGPYPLLAALGFGWGGDLALLFDADAAFLVGMASFALGHLCYLFLFGRVRTDPLVGAAYGLALVTTVVLLWPGLPGELRIPVAVYSLLLTAMAYRSGALGRTAALGGALFMLSDTLIATGVADWPQPPRPDFWIMLTYLAAQYLLATGALAAGRAYGREVTPD
ncbi:lysoplasmalogenase [Streptomyces sp. NPDC089919]|uniref:lysoplasmalogenase n=1 Tax=Streptomyces sp. NPDC089919 TaxID=3155188 RepID=UPI00342BB888